MYVPICKAAKPSYRRLITRKDGHSIKSYLPHLFFSFGNVLNYFVPTTGTNDKGWVPFPRSDLDDLHAGKITPSEYDLYVRIRHGANPYAITKVSLEALVADFALRGWKKNYINSMLLSLKEKRYLYYEDRTGRRGTFDVSFAKIKMINGAMSTLPEIENTRDKPNAPKETCADPEVGQSLPTPNQRLDDIKRRTYELSRLKSISDGRAYNNDNDNEKEKERSSPLKRKILVTDFVPASYKEKRCKEIAVVIGELYMDFLLGTLHDHGFQLIEQAWLEYERSDKTKIRGGRAAYFNGIVQKLLADKAKAS